MVNQRIKFNKEEKDIIKAFEAGEFDVVDNPHQLDLYRQYAKNTLNKVKNINIRLSLKDLQLIKRRAVEAGLPYQTLISSIIRQFNSHRLPLSL